MIELRQPEPDPVETALLEWIPAADLYADGVLTRQGLNLLGGNEVAARRWSRLIIKHLAEHGPDIDALTQCLLNPDGCAQHVRTYAYAPQIAEGIVTMLTEKSLL